MIRACIRLLTVLDLGDELDSFLYETDRMVRAGTSIEEFNGTDQQSRQALQMMLCLAEGWYGFGWDSLAQPVVQQTWAVLLSGQLEPRERTRLACCLAHALGNAVSDIAQPGLEDIFHRLPPIRDTYTTSTHFSAAQLDVVESVALAAVEVCRHN